MSRKKRLSCLWRLAAILSLVCMLVQQPSAAEQTIRTAASVKLSTMYYSQLNHREQDAYRVLLRTDLRKRLAFRWNVSVSFQVTEKELENMSWRTKAKPVQMLNEEFCRAYYAYCLDYVDDTYWLSDEYDLDYGYRYSYIEEEGKENIVLTIRYVMVYLRPIYGRALVDDNEVQAAIGNLYTYVKANRRNESRQETVLAISKVMVKNMTFANPMPDYGSTPASLVLKKFGKRGNSEAYAKMAFILCKKFSIPVVYVQSETHNFCYVQMENGIWYGLDVTWADKGNQLDKKWVLYGTGVVKKYDLSNKHDALTSKNGISLCAISISKKSYPK